MREEKKGEDRSKWEKKECVRKKSLYTTLHIIVHRRTMAQRSPTIHP